MILLKGLPGILDSKGMKPADLCRISGLSSGLISSYMSGAKTPTLKSAVTIAESLNVSLDELVGRKPSHFAPPPLTKDEEALLDDYRNCTPTSKEKIDEYAEFQSAKSKESTRDSKRSKRSA